LDVAETVGVALVGFDEQEAGIRQASIMASPQLAHGRINYVDPDLVTRTLGRGLQKAVAEHLEWLMELLRIKTSA
jgi:hypothetical protein